MTIKSPISKFLRQIFPRVLTSRIRTSILLVGHPAPRLSPYLTTQQPLCMNIVWIGMKVLHFSTWTISCSKASPRTCQIRLGLGFGTTGGKFLYLLASETLRDRSLLTSYSNGDKTWSAGPPVEDNVMKISKIEMYYNRTGSAGTCT